MSSVALGSFVKPERVKSVIRLIPALAWRLQKHYTNPVVYLGIMGVRSLKDLGIYPTVRV